MADKILIDFDINAGGNSILYFNNVEKAVTKADEAAKKLKSTLEFQSRIDAHPNRNDEEHRLGRGPQADRYGDFVGALSAAGSKAAGAMGIAAVAVTAFSVAANTTAQGVTKALLIIGNSSMTYAQKQDEMVKSFVPFGETFINLRDALNGVADTIRRANMEMTRGVGKAGAEYERIGKKSDYYSNQAAAESIVSANRVFPQTVYDPRGFDRNRLAGQIGEEEYGIRTAAGRSTIAARRGREEAWRVRDFHTSRVTESTGLANDAFLQAAGDRRRYEEFRESQNRHGAVSDQGRMTELLNAAKASSTEALLANERSQREMVRLQESELRLVNATGSARAAATNELRAESEILRNREQRMVQQARSLGEMGVGERMRAISGAEYANRHIARGGDIALLPSQLRGDLRTVDPDAYNVASQNSGEAVARDLARRGMSTYQQTFGDGRTIRDIQDTYQRSVFNVNAMIETDAEELAEKLAVAARQAFEKIESQINNRFQLRMLEIENEISRGQLGR